MAKQTLAELEVILNTVTAGLPKIAAKKMFGCHAVWVDGNVFALVWKHGRIGFKLPEPSPYETLMKFTGADPWKAGPMKMAHWVLVPEAFHAKPAELKKWAAQAHALCAKLPKKTKKSSTKAKATAKRSASA